MPLKVLFETVIEEEEDEEIIAKRIPSIILGMLSSLILKLPHDGGSIKKILKWLCQIAIDKEIEQSMGVAVIQLILNIENCTTDFGNSINVIVNQLCQIIGTIAEVS